MENTLLNLIPSSYIPEVHLSQYDIGRELKFKLMDGNTEYSVPSGASVTVKATKPSGLGFVVNAEADGNIVTLSNTETMTNESGRFSAELSISNDSTLLGTSNFIFNIERSPHPEGTTDGDAETLIPELTLLVNEIRESNAKVESMTASATSLPAGSEPTAEYDAENNNLAFGIPTSEVTAEDLYKAFITKSANGSIASFSDGGDDLPMKSLKVNIVPKQSGSGDPSPSNVRPISGWDSVDINVTGINIWDEEWEVGGLNTTTGVTTTQTDRIRSKNYIPIIGGKEYYFFNGSNNLVALLYDYNKNYTGKYYYLNANQPLLDGTDTEGCGYIKFYMVSAYGTTYKNDISINYPATDTSYHIGANNESYPISLGQTVYGGVLDVVSGKLIPDTHKLVTFNGSESWGFTASSGRNRVNRPLSGAPQGSYNLDIKGNYIKATSEASSLPPEWQGNINNLGALLIGVPTSITSADSWKSYLASNPLTVVYPTATPTEIQLTPTEVKTLLGSNNIWSESGTVEVEYRADSTLAYEELANAIISLGGNI